MNIKILIALHKPCDVPTEPMYVPLRMGAEGKAPLFRKGGTVVSENADSSALPIEGDDGQDNISAKNPLYSELTGLYHALKSWTDCDAIGLVHYRRYFGFPKWIKASIGQKTQEGSDAFSGKILSKDACERLLSEHDIIVPSKRRYYIESLYSHYSHTLEGRHLDIAADIVRELFPEYADAIEPVYKRTWGYMFNMAVMKRSVFVEYGEFIFPVLFELEKRLPAEGDELSGGSAFEKRLYGRVSEILFNVWLKCRNEFKVVEVPLYSTEHVNWLKKGTAFLSAKFFGKKYRESF